METASAPPPPKTSELWLLPNQLTMARFVLAVLLFVLIGVESWLGCLLVFVAASITDWLDGFLARRYHLTSAIGRNLDPLADKVLTCGAFIFLLPRGNSDGWLFPWMVTVIVVREMVITVIRSFLEGQGTKFGADWLGKLKMNLQCAALLAIFVSLLAGVEAYAWLLNPLRDGLVYAMVAATALSGLQYLWKAAALAKVI
jgi:CDP-diacylglycerol--glycerol-3-phosphate 3-phosphatidyltransferase